MPYATLADLIERAGEVELRQTADRDHDGVPDPDVIDAALRDADNLINGYVAAKYAVPLPSTPPLVRTLAISIARYFLHRNGAPDHVTKAYNDALASLRDIAKELIPLSVAAGEAEPVAASGQVMAAHPPQVFTDEKLRGWR